MTVTLLSPWVRRIEPIWVRVLFAILLAGVPLVAFRVFQPVPYFPDEYAHYDYVAHIVSAGAVPSRFAQSLSETADLFACTELAKGAPLTCGVGGQDPTNLPWLGENAATSSVPYFYVLEAQAARATSLVLGTELLSSLRTVSLVWTALLVASVVVVASRLGAGAASAIASGALVGTLPLVLAQSMVLQTDIPGCALIMTSIAVALSTPASLAGVAAANAVAATAIVVRWTGVLALAALSVLEYNRGPAGTRRVRMAAPLASFAVCVALVGLDRWWRPSQHSNGLQDAYVRQNWPQEPITAVLHAWWGSPAALGYPFVSSPVRPGAAVLDALVVVMTIALMVGLVAIVCGAWTPSPRVRGLAAVTLTYVLLLPLMILTVLSGLGLPLFFQPRYGAAALLLAAAVMASVHPLRRLFASAVGLLWFSTVLSAVLL